MLPIDDDIEHVYFWLWARKLDPSRTMTAMLVRNRSDRQLRLLWAVATVSAEAADGFEMDSGAVEDATASGETWAVVDRAVSMLQRAEPAWQTYAGAFSSCVDGAGWDDPKDALASLRGSLAEAFDFA